MALVGRRLLGERRRIVVARSKVLAAQVQRWLQSYAQLVIRDELELVTVKSKTDAELRTDLQQLLATFGLREAARSSRAVGFQGPLPVVVAREIVAKDAMVQGIANETRDAIRREIGEMVAEFRREIPSPPPGVLVRRIRDRFRSPEGSKAAFAVSMGRASVIARTELVQNENLGAVSGYEQLGVRRVMWLAFTGDRRSGDRKHYEMNGEVIEIGGRFVTPLDNRLRFPGDPTAPIADTANCRCTVRPVR